MNCLLRKVKFGEHGIEDILEFLGEERVIHKNGDKWYWMNDAFPAHNISLRSASQENVIIIDQTDISAVKVIGEMDRFSAMTLLHDEAIYLHQGFSSKWKNSIGTRRRLMSVKWMSTTLQMPISPFS